MGERAAAPTLEPPAPLAADLCWLMCRASQALTARLSAALDGLEISPRAYSVLAAASVGGRTQTALARTVGLDKTTMVATVDALEAAGLAERRPLDKDRRARVLGVTRAGERKLREAERVVERIHAGALDGLPEEEREVFVGALRRLACGTLAEPVPVRRRLR